MGKVIEFPRELRDARFSFAEYRLLREHAYELMNHDVISDVEAFVSDEGDSVFAYLNDEGVAVVTISKILTGSSCQYVALDEHGVEIAKACSLVALMRAFAEPFGGIREA